METMPLELSLQNRESLIEEENYNLSHLGVAIISGVAVEKY